MLSAQEYGTIVAAHQAVSHAAIVGNAERVGVPHLVSIAEDDALAVALFAPYEGTEGTEGDEDDTYFGQGDE